MKDIVKINNGRIKYVEQKYRIELVKYDLQGYFGFNPGSLALHEEWLMLPVLRVHECICQTACFPTRCVIPGGEQ